MSILVFANGDFTGGSWLEPYLERKTLLMAADGGLKHLLSLGLQPDSVVGDLDSMDRQQIDELIESGATILEFPKDKDETDLELALIRAATMEMEDIFVFGAFGGRWDQTLANVLLLSDPRLSSRKIYFVEESQKLWLIRGTEKIQGAPGDLVSLIPIDGSAVVESTKGLRWSLENEELLVGRTRGISNEMVASEAVVRLASGQLICVYSRGASI